MKKNGKSVFPSKYVLAIMTIACIIILFVSYATDFSGGPLKTVANYLFIPMQKGLNYIGSSITANKDDIKTKEQLIEENEALRAEIERLNASIASNRIQQSELAKLQELYDLDQKYMEYKTTGARIIAKGSSNWFETFTIDKGSKDGIKVGMNVIAGNGLVGIVADVGEHSATVRSIIDDTSSVSGMILSTEDICIVSGNLKSMTEDNQILLSDLEDPEDKASAGDTVVTSNVSDKYLPGLMIGYVTKLEDDANDLTKSGRVTPVVDFKHLSDVLIILQVKDTGD